MRGHVPHQKGGYVLEGKFMDVGSAQEQSDGIYAGNKDLNSVASKAFSKDTLSTMQKINGSPEQSQD